MRKLVLVVSILTLLAIVGVACGQATPEVQKEVVRETVVVEQTQVVEKEKEVVVTATPEPGAEEDLVTVDFNWATEPPQGDPALATDTTSSQVIGSIFMGLTDIDDETQEAVPALATDWSSNEDDTVWTFQLRDDVPWVHYNPKTGETEVVTDDEGNPRMVTAEDVAYGVTRSLDPRTASDYAYILYIIQGGQQLNTTDPEADNFQELMDNVGVQAVDETTVEFTLEYGASFFPQVATMSTAYPVPQWTIDEYGERWIEPGFIVTNGAYVMTEWAHGDHLTLEKNTHWPLWGTDYAPGNVERLEGIMIEEVSTAFALYENNELDTAGVPQEQIERVKEDPELSEQFVNAPVNCSYYYGFVTTKAPVDDPNVRKALSMAIDRGTLVEAVTKGGQIPANTFTNPLNFGSVAEDPDVAPWALTKEQGGTGYDEALSQGKALLDEAGFTDGAGLDIVLMHNVSEGHARIAQAIQAMWQQAYPQMTVTIETQEWQVYLDTIEFDSPIEDVPHVFRLGWCADYPHANNWVHEVFNPEAGANRIRLSADDPVVGEQVQEYAETTVKAQTAPPEEQVELYKRAEELLIEEIVGIAPIYYYTTVNVTKPWLERTYDPIKLHLFQWQLDWEAKQASMQ